MTDVLERLSQESFPYESMLCGYFWQYPELYLTYEGKISANDFLNQCWAFYFKLGEELHRRKYRSFDDIATETFIMESREEIKVMYDQYNGYNTIKEYMQEAEAQEDNFKSYYDQVRKYSALKKLYGLFGEKVLGTPDNPKYDYRRMTHDEIVTYWQDKVNQLSLGVSENTYEEHFLLRGLREKIRKWSEEPSVGLPFYKSRYMSNICIGWDYGHVYINGGFGGSGKTSMTFNKIIMSCIENKEKLLVIANEQGIEEFQQMLLTTAMGTGTFDTFDRQRFLQGEFTEEEKEKLEKAIEWIEGLTEGDDKLIAFVFMKDYVMEDCKKIIRHYANRGYRRVIVDTAKPSEGSQLKRWERFVEDFKELYKLARKDGGGLNLAIWANIQLADSALKQRFLNEYAFGDGKKAKNEASVVFLSRPMWDDEYAGGKNEIICFKYVEKDKPAFNEWESQFYEIVKEGDLFDEDDKPYRRVEFKILPGKVHYLTFTAKNRRGKDNKTGLDVLVMRPDFNRNDWPEIGWTTIHDDRSY